MSVSASPALNPATSGFALSAAVTALFNTALAWAKDAYAPLNDFMKSVGGHHWTTHGVVDLAMFVSLGVIFTKTRAVQGIVPGRLNKGLVLAIGIAALGLALWYVFT